MTLNCLFKVKPANFGFNCKLARWKTNRSDGKWLVLCKITLSFLPCFVDQNSNLGMTARQTLLNIGPICQNNENNAS